VGLETLSKWFVEGHLSQAVIEDQSGILCTIDPGRTHFAVSCMQRYGLNDLTC
jgi:hypothetical protein